MMYEYAECADRFRFMQNVIKRRKIIVMRQADIYRQCYFLRSTNYYRRHICIYKRTIQRTIRYGQRFNLNINSHSPQRQWARRSACPSWSARCRCWRKWRCCDRRRCRPWMRDCWRRRRPSSCPAQVPRGAGPDEDAGAGTRGARLCLQSVWIAKDVRCVYDNN